MYFFVTSVAVLNWVTDFLDAQIRLLVGTDVCYNERRMRSANTDSSAENRRSTRMLTPFRKLRLQCGLVTAIQEKSRKVVEAR